MLVYMYIIIKLIYIALYTTFKDKLKVNNNNDDDFFLSKGLYPSRQKPYLR